MTESTDQRIQDTLQTIRNHLDDILTPAQLETLAKRHGKLLVVTPCQYNSGYVEFPNIERQYCALGLTADGNVIVIDPRTAAS